MGQPEDVVRPAAGNEVMRVNFIDVQQGDGAVIETPDEKIILGDGGDNQMFARYLAARFRRNKPNDPNKRLFMQPQRVYHNGIVKGPSKKDGKSVPDSQLLGKTAKADGATWLVELHDDLLDVPDARMNKPFKDWKAALREYNDLSPLQMRRLELGDSDAFDFIGNPDIRVEVLGPLVKEVGGKPAVRFLGDPPKGPRIGHESMQIEDLDRRRAFGVAHDQRPFGRLQAALSHVSFLFTGDLNDESSRFLAQEHEAGHIDLRSEVFKAPHHGSADFSGGFIQKVQPVVSVVSSGDESTRKEYIHPRATIMGALGRLSRVDEPLIFVTELVAFFAYEGSCRLADAKKAKKRGDFYGFSRPTYGMVKTRTDGRRLLITTDSGNAKLKEAYAYEIDADGNAMPAVVSRA